MNSIIYPPTIDNDFERLCAVYPLIEQMRLEHNKVATLAKGDWGKYAGKFRTYAKESKARLKKLLAERNCLMEDIRWANYTPEQWRDVGHLSEEERDAISRNLFGDKEVEKVKTTEATSPLLDELKAIGLESFPETAGDDPTEDLTTYTLVGNHISRTADRATFSDLKRNEDAYLYDDKGANHFDGDFEHLCKVYWDNSSDDYSAVVTWALANLVDDCQGIIDASGDELYIWSYLKPGISSLSVRLREIDGGTVYGDASDLSFDTIYYIEIERDENVGTYGTLYAYICTGNYYDDGGSLVDSQSFALHTSKKDFRYIYAVQSVNSGGAYNYGADGWMELLDLQEGGVTEKESSDSGSGAESSEEAAALSKSETGSGISASLLLAALMGTGETGLGSELATKFTAEVLSVFDSGSGIDAIIFRLLESTETGSGVEVAALIIVLILGDSGIGSDVSMLPWLEAIFGGDEGGGFDALKALIGTIGSGSDMRLHGRTGQVRMPSQGVNL